MQYKSATGIDYVSAATPLPVTLSGTIPATITDDTTTNATMYPTWVTAATGNLPIKVSSTKLSFNPSTGALTTTRLVLAGTITGATTIAASSRFISNGGAGGGNGIFDATFSGAASQGVDLTDSVDQSGAVFAQFRKSTAAVIGSIARVTTTDAVAYNTTSDGRLKTNVRDFTAEDSGRIIDGLRPRWFDWKNSDENGKGIIGFLAQEEHAVSPALARMGAVTVGDDDPETVSKQWAVDSGKLVPVLVAEIKSLRARLAALEAK